MSEDRQDRQDRYDAYVAERERTKGTPWYSRSYQHVWYGHGAGIKPWPSSSDWAVPGSLERVWG